MEKKENISFFRAVKGVCSGLAVFEKLRTQSFPRTLLHLGMAAFLIGFLVAIGENHRIQPKLQEFARNFGNVFGTLRMTSEGFFPSKEPEKSRFMPLPYGGRLIYSPENQAFAPLSAADWKTLGNLVLWKPDLLAFGMPGTEKLWQWTVRVPDRNWLIQLAPNKTTDYFNELPEIKNSWPMMGENGLEYTPETFLSAAGSVAFLLYWGSFTITAMVLSLLFTGMFSLSFQLFGARKLQVLNFRSLWCVGIYAGFPAMIVAGCFPALDLPFFNYSTVFMFGLMIYQLMAINRIERHYSAELSGKDADNNGR